MSFIPPKAVQKAAALGLDLRRQYGRGGLSNKQASEQGIGSGVQRAVNLSNGDALTLDTIKRMKAFFDRHKVYKDKGYHDSKDSASYISWLLWGGDPGYEWAKQIVADNKQEDSMLPDIINDLENLLRRERGDHEMASSALKQASLAASDLLDMIEGDPASLDSWMEYKIYQAADALRAVRDALDADDE
jgi:hypothetical protein